MSFLLLLVLQPRAYAAECTASTGWSELRDALAPGLAAIAAWDPDAVLRAHAEVFGVLPCVGVALPRATVIELHWLEGVAGYIVADDQRQARAFSALLSLDPYFHPPSGPEAAGLSAALTRSHSDEGSRVGVEAPDQGWVEVDSRFDSTVPDTRASVIQAFDPGGQVEWTRYRLPGESTSPPARAARASDTTSRAAAPGSRGTSSTSTAGSARRAPSSRASDPSADAPFARRVVLGVATSGAAVTTGVLLGLAADAHARALDPAATNAEAVAWTYGANLYSWSWVASAGATAALGLSLAFVW